MLVRFAVENFRSFKENVEFKMGASELLRHPDHVVPYAGKQILKTSFLYGANASGKTNFIQAIEFASQIIVHGLALVDYDKKYFRLDDACRKRPGVFQFDICIKGKCFSYGFALSYLTLDIQEEWLYSIDKKEECIFHRQKDEKGGVIIENGLRFDNEKHKERFDFYVEDMKNKHMRSVLFLTDISKKESSADEYNVFKDVCSWFERLHVIFPSTKITAIHNMYDDEAKEKLSSLLKYFDTGIDSIEKEEKDFDKIEGIPSEIKKKIKLDIMRSLLNAPSDSDVSDKKVALRVGNAFFIVYYRDGQLMTEELLSNHGNQDDLFDYECESDGTKRLFDLLPIFDMALMDSVFVIDEIDRSLHTKLTHEFIQKFHEYAKDTHSQLIVSTHDSNLLDLDYIRQDEVWFVERQRDNSSVLIPLDKFKVRFNTDIERDYLLGRYGALPIFKHEAL